MKKISIVTACYNEEENVEALVLKVKKIMEEELFHYDYEHIFIDNCSEDKTFSVLEKICLSNKKVKIIQNARNFGHIRSPFYGILQSSGDCTISMAADFQEPPELIPEFVKKWEAGYKVVCAIKNSSKENGLMYKIRTFYYNLVKKISEVDLIENFTGFGLYDQKVINALRCVDDPYPYFRGLVCEIGFERDFVYFEQPKREKGKTKNSLYTLFDMAMLGITQNSKVPLRIATIVGFLVSLLSLGVAFFYFILKLIFWESMLMGTAPLVIGLFFFSSVQLFFIGLLGEYIAQILIKVTNRPLVVENKRVNFDQEQEIE